MGSYFLRYLVSSGNFRSKNDRCLRSIRGTKTKTPIFGMIQRNGNIVAMKVDNTKGATIMPIVSQFVENGATTYTDEANIYNSLTKNGYEHLFVNHSFSR